MLFEEEIQVEQVPYEKKAHTKKLWLDQVFGQDTALDKLEKTLQGGRFPHCSLISGNPGSGQLVFALHIAQSLLCKAEHRPCGVCDHCYKINQLVHPDLHFTYPTVGAKSLSTSIMDVWRAALKQNPYINIGQWLSFLESEGKQANITADESRSIIDRLSYRPYEANRTVLILWLPEFLGKEGNILLKLLEEPPANAHIILVTENKSQVIQTILSRTQEFVLPPLPPDAAAKRMEGECHISYDHAYSILIACEYDYSTAMQMASDTKNQYLEFSRAMFQRAYKGEGSAMMDWVEKFATLSKDEQKFYLHFLTQLFSLCLRIKNKIIPPSDNENSSLAYATKLGATLDIFKIEKMNTLIDDTIIYIGRNANVKILMLDFIIQCKHIIRSDIN